MKNAIVILSVLAKELALRFDARSFASTLRMTVGEYVRDDGLRE